MILLYEEMPLLHRETFIATNNHPCAKKHLSVLFNDTLQKLQTELFKPILTV